MARARLAAAFLALPGALAIRQSETEMLNSDLASDRAELSSQAGSGVSGPSYTVDMLRLKKNGYTKTFCGLSDDGCKTLEGFPGPNTYNYLTWGMAVEELQKVPRLQEAGMIYRGNELGYLILNDGLWARDFKTLGLGSTVEQHKFFRPIVDSFLGSAGKGTYWSEEMISTHLQEYMAGKMTLSSEGGIFYWTTRLMHKLHVNLDLSPADTKKFMDLQNEAIVKMVMPSELGGMLRFGELQDTRDYFLTKYMTAIKEDTRDIFPKTISEGDLKFMASSLMDSMLFAGGLSVGNLIKTGLSVLYAEPSPWRAADKSINDANVDQFVYEVIRRYPAVVGFPWYDMPRKDTRFIVNVAMALRDPLVWGSSPLDFTLRPLELYRNLTRVAWAEPANGPLAWKASNEGRAGDLVPMSRGCPGQALSFAIIKVFFRHWQASQDQWEVVKAPHGGLEFSDATPFVAAMTLAKKVRAGPITLVSQSLFGRYDGSRAWGVVTAGGDNQPPMLLIYDSQSYDKDNPDQATRSVALARDHTVYETENWLQREDPTAACFKIRGAEVRLCAAGAGADQNVRDRIAWVLALNTARDR